MILDTFVAAAPRTLSKVDRKSPGVHKGQLLLADPKPERPGYLDEEVREVRDNDPSINFGVNVKREPWTAALLLKDMVIPQELTIKRAHGRKPQAEDQRLKNAHIILSRCGFPMHVDMVVQHYRSEWTVPGHPGRHQAEEERCRTSWMPTSPSRRGSTTP